MLGPYLIRRAAPADADLLGELSQRAFVETFVEGFGRPYQADDLAAYLNASHSATAFRRWLEEPDVLAWIAFYDDDPQPAGYAMIGEVVVPHPDTTARDLELHRLYLGREHYGSGLATALMGVALAGMAQAPVQWLGVWSGNLRAQRFYARHGFEKAGEYDYPVGRTVDREFILKRTVQS